MIRLRSGEAHTLKIGVRLHSLSRKLHAHIAT